MEHGEHRRSGFDPARERAYHLSILMGQGVSACAVHDLHTAEPHFIAWAPGSEIVHHNDLPKHPRSVSFVLLPEWSTLVPDGALAVDSGAQHLSLVYGKLPDGTFRDEPVRTLGATCLYVHDEVHEGTVMDRFPNARSLPLQAVLVRGAQMRSTTDATMVVHRGRDRADVCIALGQSILLSTSYPVRSPEDLLYFCLLATNRSGLKPDRICLRIGGTHLQAAERSVLRRYFVDVASSIPTPWLGQEDDAATPIDRWSAAMDQFACVS